MDMIDLRSDTVTWPTRAMRESMAEAAVGDDVYGDDPSVLKLEAFAAELLGKDAALFVCSGTMGNQLALMAQVDRGEEVILPDQCHIVCHEAGAAAFLAGAQLRCLPTDQGKMNIEAINATIRKSPEDIHIPRTALICLENADSSGLVLDLDYMASVKQIADNFGLPVHLDGARLFNAAVRLQVEPADIAQHASTIQICLSKGLCAPAGSLLAGSEDVIRKARRLRKIIGGGMRQTGVLAAPGLIALKEMRQRLAEDHLQARWLAKQLSLRPEWFEIADEPQINMIFLQIKDYPLSGDELARALASKNILINPPDQNLLRLVTHYWISRADLQRFVDIIDQLGQYK